MGQHGNVRQKDKKHLRKLASSQRENEFVHVHMYVLCTHVYVCILYIDKMRDECEGAILKTNKGK